MIKGIIFDIDDTLYDQQKAFIQAFNECLPTYVKDVDYGALFQRMRAYGDESFTLGYEQTDLRKMQIYRIKRALRDDQIKVSDELALKFQHAFERYQEEIELFGEMPSIFERIKTKGLATGLITNGTAKRQAKKIERLRLKEWMPADLMLISEEVGIAKPKTGIFELMAHRLSMVNSELLYIGDNYTNDIIGGKSAGWQTIWANYHRLTKPTEVVETDYTVQSPKELALLLERLLVKEE
ncbi:HAD family hydrolase [Vagococcus sp. BWB3-3]|uniref:HAD family hydrolase n=1 Tax=Vagococcus allomyrinae TaxID=2794353 RepID=A0A940PA46_9ENTE|nr:HAD family hydrolase [Vagococcus allomyrinae]MBP1042421.1 HAD family hydrolase [Vagococcus allomyrinae]